MRVIVSLGASLITAAVLHKLQWSERRDKERIEYVILVLYFLVILWITIFSRDASDETVFYYDIIKSHTYIISTIAEGFKKSGFQGALQRFRWVEGTVEGHTLNTVLFIPVGYLIPICYKKADRWYRIVILGCVISIAIEVTQLITRRGWFDANDIYHNTLGTLIGWFIFRKWIKVSTEE